MNTRNYFFIDGPAAIGLSGGRTSGYMMHEILRAHNWTLPADVYVTFENTGKECEETLVFIEEMSQRWSLPTIWLEYDDVFDPEKYKGADGEWKTRRKPYGANDWGFRIVDFKTASRNGEPYDKMLTYYRKYRRIVKEEPPILPTVPSRMCTTHLKIKPNTRFMQSQGYQYFDFVVGIRKDEPRRWTKMMKQNEESSERYNNVCPLYSAGISKEDIKSFWQHQPFDLQLDAESYEGNCRYCFLKSTGKLLALMQKNIRKHGVNQDLLWWAEKEEESGMFFRKDRPSYRNLINMAQEGIKVNDFNIEPVIDCLCGEAND